MLGAVLGITGQHGGDNTQFLDPGNRFHGIVFQGIRDDDVTDKPSVFGNQHLGAKSGFLISGQVNIFFIHHLAITAQQRISSGFRLNSMTGNFFYIQRTLYEKVLFPGSVYVVPDSEKPGDGNPDMRCRT